ncbi:Os04g0661250 [Oryza sativa Japonica Group]|uniref:Os04g0661250 protein n=1 Tax=Oryza sativa subsp. japonica TaxID=39947 RepID=A0A0P0WFW9_ORYSJ|nr:hypothetical protein EE612_026078 [Oryza sativa]BAS91455.1 Os04g0661250 [Oryza sativa Japonica Group]
MPATTNLWFTESRNTESYSESVVPLCLGRKLIIRLQSFAVAEIRKSLTIFSLLSNGRECKVEYLRRSSVSVILLHTKQG